MTSRKIISLCFVVVSFLFLSCNVKPGLVEPIDESGILGGTVAVSEPIKKSIEGIYKIKSGNEYFGNYAVVKYVRNHFSIFCEKNSSYLILNSGERDSSIYFEGYWRFSQNLSTGKVSLKIEENEGGKIQSQGNANSKSIIIKGIFTKENNGEESQIRLEYYQPVKQDSTFYIIAHRGGGRNTDRLPASENSLEILQIAEYFGANSVEIDIQLTKDKVPILYHDEEFSQRLVKGNYLIGKVSSFSFKQIRTFGKLLNDGNIPTLEEALDLILNKTSLKLVWLDVKYPETIPFVAPIQKKYSDLAKLTNRGLTILIGLPTEEVMNEYLNYPGKENHPSLCELDISSVRLTNANVWAPRWTDGIPKQQITAIQAENRKVFVWTLDIPQIIRDFIHSNYYDGILSNYPSVVAYEYFMKDVK